MAENSKLVDAPYKGQIEGNATYNGTSWQIRVKIMQEDGSIKYTIRKGFATSEEASEAKAEYDKKFEHEARLQGLASNVGISLSTQEYFKYYLEEILSSYCEPSTEMVYRYTLYKYILPNFENEIPLELLADTELNQLLEKLQETSKIVASKAREFMFLALKNAYYKEKRIAQIPKMIDCPRPNANVTVLKKDEIKKLLAVASETNWYLEILLALFLGLRKGEIQGLKFSDFDEQSQSVHITRQLAIDFSYEDGGYKKVSSERVEKNTKTPNSVRILYVPTYVWQEVKKRKAWVEDNKLRLGDTFSEGDYVSCTENGKPRGASSINTTLTKLCRQHGIRHTTLHGLRHCYATILYEKKYDLPTISALLGHSSVTTTYNFYVDIIEGNEEILTCLNELYAVDEESER